MTQILKYLNGTRRDKWFLPADNIHVIKLYVHASFDFNHYFKSQTGGVIILGGGTIQSISRKKNMNTQSRNEAGLVGANEITTMILWTRLLMGYQGYNIDKNILYQDNKSLLSLKNGKKSSRKQTRALNIYYFFK